MLIKRQQGFEIIAIQLMSNHKAAICYQVFFFFKLLFSQRKNGRKSSITTSDLMRLKEIEESKRERHDKEQWLQREGMEEGGGGRRGDG